MLLRRDPDGVLAIGQASHAWLSGQLARAWGNGQFGSPEPREEVCLAADQHDVGWPPIDDEPLFDLDSGLPRSFMDMPLEVHLDLWANAPHRLATQSTYATILVSMHGCRLYERRDLDRHSLEEANAIRSYLTGERMLQRGLLDQLQPDPESLERNSLLLWTWDYLSLALCLGWDPATARAVPSRDGHVDLELRSASDGSFAIEPWPFAADAVTVRCEGRRLPGRFNDEAEMRRGLAQAPLEILELLLARKA